MIRQSQIIICSKNNTRENFIHHIRHDILGYNSTLPLYGERVVCRKNNWNIESNGINLTNGLLGNVINYPDASGIDPKNKTYKLNFKPDLGDLPFNDLACDYKYLVLASKY